MKTRDDVQDSRLTPGSAGIEIPPGVPKSAPGSSAVLLRFSRSESIWMLLVFIVAVGVRLIRLDHTPQWDEMYHFLAAQSWLDNGSFAIADGEYVRARLFTIVVAGFMSVFGETLAAARLPAVLSGALGVALLYRFTAAQAGRIAGLVAAGLLCFHPLSIYVAQLARFYAPHALCFWVGAYALFKILTASQFDRRTVFWALLAVACFGLGYHFQITTVVGIGSVAVWFGTRLGWTWFQRLLQGDRRAPWVWVALVGAAGIAGAVAWKIGFVDFLLENFRATQTWAREHAMDEGYYHRWLNREVPLLWTFFPVAVLIAIWQRRAFAFFCAVVFAVVFVTHSLAGSKADRFVFYGMPFFFAIWGIAIAPIQAVFPRILREVVSGAFENPPSERLIRLGAAVCGVGLLLSVAVLNPAAGMTFKMLAQPDAKWKMPHHYRGFADWQAAAPTLRPLAGEVSVVLASSGVKSLYFLGRSDFDISKTVLHETDTDEEFGTDRRTGKQVISSADSLATIMNRFDTGLIVIERQQWGIPHNVPHEIASYIEAHTEPVPLKKEWRLMAFRWQRPTDEQAKSGSP